jgi:glycosyltransferase involved in cell wall biosynthesis
MIPRISVIMSVYNAERHLADAIRSILNQTFTDFEFLIVNDGSRDSSAAIMDAFAESDPRIRVIRQENRGLIASLNRMLDEARAPLVARMDADDISLPTRFERQIAFLSEHTDHGVVGTNTHELDEGGIIFECSDLHPLDHFGIATAMEYRSPICHPSVMMRRDAILAVGGYRRPYTHCEDYDLWLRLLERTRLANLPDRLLLYRRSPGQVSARHEIDQKIGAALAWAAHLERAAGRSDPTVGLQNVPVLDALDILFAQDGVTRAVRSKVALGLIYSATAMRGRGFDLLLRHINDDGYRDGLWRTVVRLITFRQPFRAFRLATALIRNTLVLRAPQQRSAMHINSQINNKLINYIITHFP